MSKVFYCNLPKGLGCTCERDGFCENWGFSHCVYKASKPKADIKPISTPTTGSKAVKNNSDDYIKGFAEGYRKGFLDGIKQNSLL